MTPITFTAEDFPNAPHRNSGALYTAQHAADDANAALSRKMLSQPWVYKRQMGAWYQFARAIAPCTSKRMSVMGKDVRYVLRGQIVNVEPWPPTK